MALTLGDNFSYGGSKPLDARLTYSTLAEMKAVADSTMYNGCLAYCVETDKTYQWKLSNTVDPDTGRWREFQTGSTIVVDDAISSSSENPVQNKVIKTALDGKVNTESGKGLSTNDYTTAEKNKLAGLSNYDDTEVRGLIAEKQDELTAGANITFDGNIINAPLPIIANQFDKANLYSTTEKVVGCWTDGRPLYQRTYQTTMPSVSGPQTSVTLVTLPSTCRVKNLNVFTEVNSGDYFPLPWNLYVGGSVSEGNANETYAFAQANVIQVNIDSTAGSTFVGKPVSATVQYTKTTDAANSFNYADENDYSTTEKIVGTWIDGKPLYQKTVTTGGNVPSGATLIQRIVQTGYDTIQYTKTS